MPNMSAYNAYKKTSVTTASRERLLLMLYDGAIKFGKLAKKAIEEDKVAEKGQYIGRIHDIIMELNNSLDFKVGGDIAGNLEALYMFMVDELIKANMNNDVEPLNNVLGLLETLRNAWAEAIMNLKTDGKPGEEPKKSVETKG